jgi:hypothetical protein
MKTLFIILVLSCFSHFAFAQEGEFLTAHDLKIEREIYKEQEKKDKLDALKKLYPTQVPGVIVTNAGKLLGSKVANLEVTKNVSFYVSHITNFNCDHPGFLDRLVLFQFKNGAERSVREKAEAEAEQALSKACSQIGGKLNISEIYYKKINQKLEQENISGAGDTNILKLNAHITLEARGLCDRIGE